MKRYSFLKILMLICLPLFVFFTLNKYFYGNLSPLGKSTPNLQILDSARSLEGVMPVHFFKKDKKLLLGIWYEKIKSQDELIDKESQIYPTDSYPTYITKKIKERGFELKYKRISEEDFSFANNFYFTHSPYLVKKMDNGTYITSVHASGMLYVFRGVNNEKLFGIEMDSETENDFGTHETLIFQNNKILYQHVRNIARDADISPVIIFLATGFIVLLEIGFILRTRKNRRKAL